MNLIDRLIARAQKVKLACGDNVFIISNETGEWTVEGCRFPDCEAALEYVEGLLPADADGCTVIVNDLEPSIPEPEKEKDENYREWLAAVKAEQELKENGGLEPFEPKDRRLI